MNANIQTSYTNIYYIAIKIVRFATIRFTVCFSKSFVVSIMRRIPSRLAIDTASQWECGTYRNAKSAIRALMVNPASVEFPIDGASQNPSPAEWTFIKKNKIAWSAMWENWGHTDFQ
jgi:hypothetical protein